MQLKVVKADGSVEEYLHTKIIGAVSCALAHTGQADVCIAEQLAEAVTYFLYHRQNRRSVSSSEIFFIIEAVLTDTGYEESAAVLSEHHFERRLKRSRIEVVSVDIRELSDAERLVGDEEPARRGRWDKSIIVEDLITRYDVSRQTARTIASMVEQRVLSMAITLVPVSLVRQLVLGEAAAVLRAQRQLAMV